jgi:fumarate reductase subunit D
MGDFLKSHFDKLLLTGLLLTLFFATIHTLHHGTDAAAVNWLENTVGQVLAALLTLMVGQRLQQRNGDNKPPVPASPPIPVAVPGETK